MVKWAKIALVLASILMAFFVKSIRDEDDKKYDEYQEQKRIESEKEIKFENDLIDRLKKNWTSEGKTEIEIIELFRVKWQKEGRTESEIEELIKTHLKSK